MIAIPTQIESCTRTELGKAHGQARTLTDDEEARKQHGAASHLVGLDIFVALAVVLAPAHAGADYREFTGRIDKINKKKLIVDNRQGDKVSFVPIDTTEVSGEKTEWKKLKRKDWVTVSWKFVDKPRKAYKVLVLPPRGESGSDL